MVDEFAAKAAFKGYTNALNRRIYRSAYRHHDKRLSRSNRPESALYRGIPLHKPTIFSLSAPLRG